MLNYTDEVEKYGSVRAASRALGIPRTTLQRALKRERGEGFETLEQDVVKTSDALTDACETMNILQHEVKAGWIKSKEASVYVKREMLPVDVDEAAASIARLLESSRKHNLYQQVSPNADSMLVICPVDAHFGKLSYSGEVRENYDPEITSAIYRQAVADSLTHFNPLRIKRIVLVIGSDQMHAESSHSQTTSGTLVESVDTRYTRVFDIAVAATIAAIEDCALIANTTAIVVPGNHDMLSSCLLAKVVKQYFRNDPRVTVDDDEILRKYVRFGTNLIGLTHKFNKINAAPIVMATERPHDWGETSCREWLTGHLHTTRAESWSPYYELNGVVVRITSSISATDLWHYSNGFCMNRRASESWIYSETDGMYGMHVAKVRQ